MRGSEIRVKQIRVNQGLGVCSRVSSECYHTFAKLVPYGISRVVTMVLGGLLDPLKSAVKFKKEIDKDNFTFKPLIFQPSIIQDGHEAQTFDSV